MRGAALLLFPLFLLLSAATSQRCEIWAGAWGPFPSRRIVGTDTRTGDPPECASVLANQEIYLIGPLTQLFLADQIRNLTAQITTLVQAVFPKCAEVALPFACKNAFPRCVRVNDTTGDGAGFPFPSVHRTQHVSST